MIGAISTRRAVLAAALGLVLAGGVPRFLQAWSHRNVPVSGPVQEEGYYESALGLLSYHTFSIGVPNDTPRAWRGPIFPVFIALIEAFSPEPDPGKVRLAQAALSTAAILLVFVLGAVVCSPAAGLLGAALLALDANQAAAVSSLNIHGFYSFLILSACAALLLWMERPTGKTTFLAGAFLGLTLLCRSSHYLSVPLIAAAAWFWRPLPGPRWRAPALLILGAALALAPMAVRNRAVAGRWLLLPDAFGGAVALFGATTGQEGLNSFSVEQAVALAEASEPGFTDSALAGGDLHAAILDLAVRRISDDPLRFAGLCLRRLALLARALWLPFVLGMAGLALQRRNRRLQIVLLLASSFAGYCVAGGAPEHQAAALPLLHLLAGCGVAILLGRLPGAAPAEAAAARGWRRTVLAAAPALGAALYAACLLGLAVEARQRLWRGDMPAIGNEDRALAFLRIQAEQGGPAERRTYGENLARNAVRWAETGDCAKALPRLRLALRFETAQPALAGAAAACMAASSAADEARALAAAYRGRPLSERSEFWKACIVQSERMGDSAPLALLAQQPAPDADARRRVIRLWIKRADAAARKGEKESALAALAQVSKLDPDDASRQHVIEAYRGLKEYRLAAAQLEALRERQAKDPAFWIARAELLSRGGGGNEALRDLARAERQDSLTPDERSRIVGVYRELKDDRRAAAALAPLIAARPRDAGPRLDHAELSIRLGKREEALRSLAGIESLPGLTPEQRRRAVGLYRELKEPRLGAAALAPLLETQPRETGLWTDSAEFSAQSGDRAAALASLDRAERLPTLTRDERARIVELYRELKDDRRAAAALGPLIAARPRDAGPRIDHAELSVRLGEPQKALKSLAGIESLPGLTPEHRRRAAGLFRHLKDPRRGDAVLKPLLERSPDDAGLLLLRAEFRSQAGDRDGALAALARAEKRGSLTDEQRLTAVGLYRDMKEPRRGAAALAPLLGSRPRDAGLWADSAEFYAQAGDRTGALSSLGRAEKLSSAAADPDGELHRRFAHLYQALGEHGRCVAVLTDLTRRFPDEGAFHADKGLCEYLGGDARAAVASLETAIRLEPKFIPAYLTLGAIHAAKGRREEALKVYDEGLARCPEQDGDPLRKILAEERRAAAGG